MNTQSIESRIETLEESVSELREELIHLRNELTRYMNDSLVQKAMHKASLLPSKYCTPRPEGYVGIDNNKCFGEGSSFGCTSEWGGGGFGTINSIDTSESAKPSVFVFEEK